MDVRDACVKVFDRKGALIKTIGRRGEGPGEVQTPNKVSLIGNRRLFFEDFLSRINVYELDGRFIKAIPTPGILPLDVMVTRREKIFARVNCREPGKYGKEIRLYDERMNPIKTCLFMPEPPTVHGVVRPFAAGFYWALDPDDTLFVSYLADYQIDVFNASGDLIRRILREYDPVEIDREDIKNIKIRPDRKPEILDHHPAIQSLATDDDGRIIVGIKGQRRDGNMQPYDVFDAEGKYWAGILLPQEMKFSVWKKGKLYAVEENEEGFQILKKYKVFWKIQNEP